jgi:hypothetical protein
MRKLSFNVPINKPSRPANFVPPEQSTSGDPEEAVQKIK